MPMLPVRPVMRLRAAGLGWYPSSLAAASTRSRVVPRTRWDALRARDTVEGDTWARRATSWMVTGIDDLPQGAWGSFDGLARLYTLQTFVHESISGRPPKSRVQLSGSFETVSGSLI